MRNLTLTSLIASERRTCEPGRSDHYQALRPGTPGQWPTWLSIELTTAQTRTDRVIEAEVLGGNVLQARRWFSRPFAKL